MADPNSYRGINIIMSLGKIIDKVVLLQVLTYLVDNGLVHEAHHGSIKGRSTATAVTTLVDTWTQLTEQGHEVAVIALDQSAAYDLIDHPLLLQKMSLLGFQKDTLNYFTSYLEDRSQVVYLDGVTSDSLHIGSRSVVQGSVMSCVLFLIYIIDMPTIFHQSVHNIQDTYNCKEPAIQTFVDDAMCSVVKVVNIPLQQSVDTAIDTIEDYMQANHLALNRDKTQLMILNKDPPLQSKVELKAEPENINPSTSIKFLGITLTQTMDWKMFLLDGSQSLHRQLTQRINALKKVRKYISFKFAKNLANAIFMSMIHYGAELWGGAPTTSK